LEKSILSKLNEPLIFNFKVKMFILQFRMLRKIFSNILPEIDDLELEKETIKSIKESLKPKINI